MGLPGAGLWAVIFLVAAVLQIGLLVLVPAVIFVFATATTTEAVIFLIWCIVVGLLDNVLKPLLLGRGASVPTVVVFLGAIGGFVAMGIIGLFVSELDADQVRELESRDLQDRKLRATMEMLRRTDSQWVTAWVVQNLLAGALRPDGWIDLVDGLTEAQRNEFLKRVTSDDLTEMRVPGVIPLLRKFTNREIVRRLFRRICELIPIIATSKPGDDKQAEAKLARQLEDLLREMPSNPAVNGILEEIGGRTDAVHIEVVTEIFH